MLERSIHIFGGKDSEGKKNTFVCNLAETSSPKQKNKQPKPIQNQELQKSGVT